MCRVQVHGHWADGTCWVVQALNSMCLKVKMAKDSAGKVIWVPAGSTPEHSGCMTDHMATYIKAYDKKHSHKRPVKGHDAASPPKATKIKFTVRYENDPQLALWRVTDHAMTFGPTPHQLGIEAITLMTVGSLILCPLVILVTSSLQNQRSRSTKVRPRASRYDKLSNTDETSEVSRGSVSGAPRRRGRSKDLEDSNEAEAGDVRITVS